MYLKNTSKLCYVYVPPPIPLKNQTVEPPLRRRTRFAALELAPPTSTKPSIILRFRLGSFRLIAAHYRIPFGSFGHASGGRGAFCRDIPVSFPFGHQTGFVQPVRINVIDTLFCSSQYLFSRCENPRVLLPCNGRLKSTFALREHKSTR